MTGSQFRGCYFLVLWLIVASVHTASTTAVTAQTSGQCDALIYELNRRLQNGYTKINVMPVLSGIVTDVRKVYEKAKDARDDNNETECVRLAKLGLKYARW